jgi:hypothetical protein
MDSKHKRALLFWLALALFITWDFKQSKAIDLRFEAPLIALSAKQAADKEISAFRKTRSG